jgi:hypothetical protein
MDMESSELFQRLKIVSLSEYCKLLWDAGFRDPKSVASMTEEQLHQAGVQNTETVNKLLHEFGKLNSDLGSEGSPRYAIAAGQEAKLYQALYDYSGNEDTDLSIKKGGLVAVLDTSRENKWMCLDAATQKQGFCPPWVFGNGSRLKPSHTLPSDCGECSNSYTYAEKCTEQCLEHKSTLLEVAPRSGPGNTEKETTLSVATESMLQDSAAFSNSKAVPKSQSPGVEPPVSNTVSKDMNGMSPSCLSNAGTSERSQDFQSSQADQSSLSVAVSTITAPTAATGVSSHAMIMSDGPQDPVESSSMVNGNSGRKGGNSDCVERNSAWDTDVDSHDVYNGHCGIDLPERVRTTSESSNCSHCSKIDPKNDNSSTGKCGIHQRLHDPSPTPEEEAPIPQLQAEISKRTPPTFAESSQGVTVEFQVVVHEEWKFDSDKSVHIRFGDPEVCNWERNCVDMEPLEPVGSTRHILFIGKCIIPTDATHKTIPYKYVVVSKECEKKPSVKEEYEYIGEGSHHGTLNRALIIPETLRGQLSGFYRKYDDVILKRPSLWKRFPLISSVNTDKGLALEAMLPKWPGFCGLENQSLRHRNFTAGEALQELQNVVTSLKYMYVWEDKQPEYTYGAFQANLKIFTDQVISKAVQKHVEPQFECLAKKSQEESSLILPSAVALSTLVSIYKFDLKFDHLVALLKSLMIHPDVNSCICCDYDYLLNQIQDIKAACVGVEHVIKIACSHKYCRPSEWLLALPVLHFLRGDVLPFCFPEVEDGKTKEWWGLENLWKDAKEYRKRQLPTSTPLQLLDEIKVLCVADRLTARSFLYSLTLEQLLSVDIEALACHPLEFVKAVSEKLTDIPKNKYLTVRATQSVKCNHNLYKTISLYNSGT